MKLQIADKNQIKDFLSSFQIDLPNLNANLIEIITDYLLPISENLSNQWENLLSTSEYKGSYYAQEVIDHFKKTFLATLSAVETKPNEAVTLNLYYKPSDENQNDRTFNTAFEALEYLLTYGVNQTYRGHMFYPRERGRMYNLDEHIQSTDLKDNSALLEPLKKLLLALPKSQEYILNQPELRILKDFLKMNDSKNLNKIAQALPGYEEPPIYYFYQEQENYSLITLSGNYKAARILGKISQYTKDEENFLKRLNPSTFLKLESLLLLPTVLNVIITDYTNNVSSSAQSLHEQLQILKNRYADRFSNLGATPDVLSIFDKTLQAVAQDQSVRFYWGGRNHHAFELNEEYEYKAIKVIEKLIKGVPLHYGSSESTRERFQKTETRLFYLLKFFKDIELKGASDPAIEKFILELLELANTHTVLQVSKAMLQGECKAFSLLTGNSSRAVRIEAEKQLNSLLQTHCKEEWPVNFVIDDDKNHVTLFVKSEALQSLAALQRYLHTVSIHLSPLFIHGLLQKLSQLAPEPNYMDQWRAYKEQKRGEVIKYFISKHYQVDAQTVRSAQYFGSYGYEVELEGKSCHKIKNLFWQKKSEQIVNPAAVSLQNVIQPLVAALKPYQQGANVHIDKVFNFLVEFEKDYKRQFDKITSEENALQTGISFLQTWQKQLTKLSDSTDNLVIFSNLPDKITDAIKQAKKNMNALEVSLDSLLKQSSTGKIALMLHSYS